MAQHPNRKRDIYKAIMIAADKGKGLHLTAEEVLNLSLDDAISDAAHNALTKEELSEGSDGAHILVDWSRQKPWITGEPDNCSWPLRDRK